MQLSRKEQIFRIKFIQECHYNKAEQRIFDEAVAAMGETYKRIYKSMRSGYVYTFMALIASNRLSRAFYNMGVSAAEAAESIQTVIRQFSKIKNKEMTLNEVLL